MIEAKPLLLGERSKSGNGKPSDRSYVLVISFDEKVVAINWPAARDRVSVETGVHLTRKQHDLEHRCHSDCMPAVVTTRRKTYTA